MNVVILCAGLGSRLGGKCPKALLTLYRKQTILDRALEHLLVEGFKQEDIIVVVSSHPSYARHRRLVEEHLWGGKGRWLGVKMQSVTFPRTGVEDLYTFLKCRNLYSHTMVLLGDVIFTKEALHEILTEPFKKIMFVGDENEIYAVLMNKSGSELFYILGVATCPLDYKLRHLYGASKQFCKLFMPNGPIMDIDTKWDYRRAQRMVRQWK